MRFSPERLPVNRRAVSRRTFVWRSLLAAFVLGSAANCLLAAEAVNDDATRAQQRETFGVKPTQPQSQQPTPVITTVAISPDGTQVATAGDDHLINLWNIDDGKLAHQLRCHADWVRVVSYSPDGKWLASAGDDRKIHLWDTASGTLIRKFGKHEAAIYALQFDPSGKTIAVAGFENLVRLYDANSGDLIRTMECSTCGTVRFSSKRTTSPTSFSPD